MMKTTRVLFVCMGNICRSPTAEGVFRNRVGNYPSLAHVDIDSCGTIGYHQGEPSDPRSVKAARARGYDLSDILSRKLEYQDLETFDYILVMDKENYSNTIVLAEGNQNLINKVKLFLEYSENYDLDEVPDPYYGGEKGFDHVIDLIEDASEGFIASLLS